MSRNLLNAAAFQIGWFACVLGAAWGWPWAGPFVVLAAVSLQLCCRPGWASRLRLMALAAVYGFLLDSLMASQGVFIFRDEWLLDWLSRPWMVALWPNFAFTLHCSLSWLLGRYWLGAALGAVSGPLAYWAGSRLGAVDLGGSWALIVLAFVWAVSLPLLLFLASLTSSPRSPRTSLRPLRFNSGRQS